LIDKEIFEIKLYDEPFVYYDALNISKGNFSIKSNISERICLMDEGHCMRTQMLELCNLSKKKLKSVLNIEYKAGSIDGLTRFVKSNKLTTLLPYLSVLNFTKDESKHVSAFESPTPYRTVGLIVNRHFVKRRILDKLKSKIIEKVSEHLPSIYSEGQLLSPKE
jgi:LysR family hydrogen peroxide-inducible transcriptional activator